MTFKNFVFCALAGQPMKSLACSRVGLLAAVTLIFLGLMVSALPLLAQSPPTKYFAFDFPGATITEAFATNDNGKTVGGYCFDGDLGSTCAPPGFSPSHGYVRVYKAGVVTYQAINYPGAFETETIGINNHNLIVGLFDPKHVQGDSGRGFYCQYPCTAAGDFHTVDFPGATATDLQSVNNLGNIVGVWSTNPSAPVDHGFLYSVSTKKFCKIDVPFTGGSGTNSLGINDSNDVVGSYDESGIVTAFVLKSAGFPATGKKCTGTYSKFVYPQTGVTQTEAQGINNAGVIVGNYLDSSNVSHAFWRAADGTFTTIDFQPGPTGDNAATSVNTAGQVVGNFTDSAGKERAFRAH